MKIRIWGAARALFAALSIVSVVGLALPAQAQSRTLPDFTDLVEQVGPSVVNIRTSEKVTVRNQPGQPGEEEMLDFFGDSVCRFPTCPSRGLARASRNNRKKNNPRALAQASSCRRMA